MFLFITTLTFTLGVWQLYRLNWKNDLIGNIESTIKNPEFFQEKKIYNELTSVILNNRFNLINNPIFIESKISQNKVGYHVLVPILIEDSVFSMLNLGWVPDKNKNNINHLIDLFNEFDEVRVYIRNFNSDKPLFVPENNINKNIWYHINKIDMQLFYEKEFNSQYYFVILDAKIKKFISNPSTNLNNNHLNYAITWFLLSLSSVVMLLIIRRKNG
tara:strand:+ start:4842 stop:5489 length:648 start_codon:yes stop_codon:yes gene_type:complete